MREKRIKIEVYRIIYRKIKERMVARELARMDANREKD